MHVLRSFYREIKNNRLTSGVWPGDPTWITSVPDRQLTAVEYACRLYGGLPVTVSLLFGA